MPGRVTFAPAVDAIPGQPAVCELVVENTATAPDVFTFEVEGEPARWTTVSPSRLHVAAGERGVARVTCCVPRRPDPTAGALILRIDVASRVDRRRSPPAETVLRIAAFADLSAALGPVVSTGWRSGDHTVTLRNHGNAPVIATIGVQRADGDLVVAANPPTLAVQPGAASVALVTATCRNRLTRGPAQRRSFALVVNADGVAPTVLEGEMLQHPRPWLRRIPAGS